MTWLDVVGFRSEKTYYIRERGPHLTALIDPDHRSDGHRFIIQAVNDIYGTSSPASDDLRWDDSAVIKLVTLFLFCIALTLNYM